MTMAEWTHFMQSKVIKPYNMICNLSCNLCDIVGAQNLTNYEAFISPYIKSMPVIRYIAGNWNLRTTDLSPGL